MTLSGRIARLPGVKHIAAGIFVAAAFGTFVGFWLLDAPTAAMMTIPAVVLLTAIPVALAPTATMDARWFHAFPLLVVFEAGAAMWAMAPHPAVAAPVIVFLGVLVPFLFMTRPAIVLHLGLATVVMIAPVVAGQSDLVSTLTILCCIAVMWGFAATSYTIWSHAEDAAAQLDELAQRDPLTGLGNRRLLDDRLEYELIRHARLGNALTLVVLDLNGFKAINDTLGHGAGDDLLRAVATALTAAVREQDTVTRPGGDEFCVIAPDAGDLAAPVLVEHLRASLRGVSAADRPLEAAFGFAVYPRDGASARELFEFADSGQRDDKPDGRRASPLVPAG